MLKTLKLTGMIIALAGSSLVNADMKSSVAELEAYTVASKNHTAVIFYTKLDNNQFEVVTTVGSNPGIPQLMTQHRITLDEGQSYTFQMDQGVANDATDSITITANTEVIEVAHR
ncbi:MAG: hypothetical protein AB8B87_24005 [Granulosicoccus sp.]